MLADRRASLSSLQVEYDLSSSSKDQLVISHRDRVEQVAMPLCLAWYPQFGTESFILTANSCYKMKLYNTTTKMCRLGGDSVPSPLTFCLGAPS